MNATLKTCDCVYVYVSHALSLALGRSFARSHPSFFFLFRSLDVCIFVVVFDLWFVVHSLSSMGDMVELVDGDFDEDNDDDVDEQSIGNEMRDLAENLLWINRAVKTSSSSSFSNSESLFGVGGTNLPVSRKVCSSSSNWPIKLRFGEMIGRANFTNLYASSNDNDLYRIT